MCSSVDFPALSNPTKMIVAFFDRSPSAFRTEETDQPIQPNAAVR